MVKIRWSPSVGILLAGLAVATSVGAAPQVVTLDDGRQVILHDDFTWQYVVPVEQRQHREEKQLPAETKPNATATATATTTTATTATTAISATPIVTAPVVTAPMAAKIQGVHFVPGANKDIQQLSRSGVDVVLHSADYRNGRLEIPTSLTNQSSQSVVLVELQVTLRNEQGRELARAKNKIWTSVKRMPETYFRAQTQRDGKPVKVSVPKAKSYFIEAEIVEVEHW